MTWERSKEQLVRTVRELRKLPQETEWTEFKTNNDRPQEIGEYISALSNAAALEGRARAYMVWGIENTSHDIVGTNFEPFTAKVGNEPLETWLLRLLSPRIDFRFFDVPCDEGRVVLLEICPAVSHPVKFSGEEFVRVGSSKKKLKEYPEKERALWRALDKTPFEKGVAAERVSDEKLFELLDVASYFDLLGLPLPDGRAAMLDLLASDDIVARDPSGEWNITMLGGALFAKRLDEFSGLKRKAMRVVVYKGRDRTKTEREQVGTKGYAAGFEGLMNFINALVPKNEILGEAFRREMPMYPLIAVRELVANAVIHQDFSQTGTGPMVEIFSDRMEITNPGNPLVPTDRFLDSPPRSRNEILASLMRRFSICEERGSGIDKVVLETEFHQLPAPLFEAPLGSTRITLFAHKKLSKMDRTDRVRACYLHACLKWVQRDFLTNASLRERFKIDEGNRAMVSRFIRDAVDDGLIVPHEPDAAPKQMKYVPFWAKDGLR